MPGADVTILQQLACCGLLPDEPPAYQSQRGALYQRALDQLIASGHAYPCACTRADIAIANAAAGRVKPRHGELSYPGTCRPENGGLHGKPARAWRLRVPDGPQALWHWHDRRLGDQQQNLADAVGDFVIRRADGLWAYQLAVVVDDGAQGVTDIVRGEDLADNTPRQCFLQQCLGLPAPRYLHTPLVLGPNGEKLSKQNGAAPVDLHDPLAALQRAGQTLGLHPTPSISLNDWLTQATTQWATRWLDSNTQA